VEAGERLLYGSACWCLRKLADLADLAAYEISPMR